MKKTLIFILFLFLLVGCKLKEQPFTYIGVSKMELTRNIQTEKPYFELYLFASSNYHNLKIKKTKDILSVTEHKQTLDLIVSDQKIPGIMYIFKITLLPKDLVYESLTLIYQNKEIEFSIGMFQTLFLESSTTEVSSNIECNNGKGRIYIYNHLYNPLYLLEETRISISKKHRLTMTEGEKVAIYNDNLKSRELFSYQLDKEYHQVGGIIQSKFQTNLSEYKIYTTYYINTLDINQIIKEGIDISSLAKIYS